MNSAARWTIVVCAFLLAGCRSDGIGLVDASLGPQVRLAIVSGNTQSGPANVELPAPLVASVTDSRGRAVSGAIVNFRVTAGGGSVFAGASISDKSGLVRDWWTLGASGAQAVEARAVDPTTGEKLVYATFSATVSPPSALDADGDGYPASVDCNDGNALIHPGALDAPDASFVDSNCDGIDGDAALAIFVAPVGMNTATCGTINAPCQTITFGISRAVTTSKNSVYIGNGTYAEAVTLTSGVSLYGGYGSGFTTRSNATRATVNGSADVGDVARVTLLADNLVSPTAVVSLIIEGGAASGQRADGSGKNSAAIMLRNVSSGIVTLDFLTVRGGAGSAGAAGANGTAATQVTAAAGANGVSGRQFQVTCDANSRTVGGAGGGSGSLAGGRGGAGGTMDTNCGLLSLDFTATSGSNGDAAAVTLAPSFGLGGLGGSGGTSCGPTGNGLPGVEANGSNGTGGSGGAVVSGSYVTAAGGTATLGNDGGGGGGGGGAGGCDNGTDSYGSSGGGGGAGGVRASAAGAGGKGGGASFGILLINASPTISNTDIPRGVGGAGGTGGAGALGQPGSAGGRGGPGIGGANGGNGGAGAAGGAAGAGGGGAGGVSAGIGSFGGSPTLTLVSFSVGTGGTAGAGGAVAKGGSGSSGTAGAVTTVATP